MTDRLPHEKGFHVSWDQMHPRALLRLSDQTTQQLIDLLRACEEQGRWPSVLDMVVICLLPKPDGRFRPIGLLPWLVRIWMKVRRDMAAKWERQNTLDI